PARLAGSIRLGRAPGLAQPSLQLVTQLVDRDPRLLQGVPVAERDCAVVERLVVDRHAPGRADLVLAAVPLADRAALVVLGGHTPANLLVDLACDLRLPVLRHERQHGDLHRSEPRGEAQTRALARLDP